VSRYSFRTQVQQPTLANWGKAAPAGIGVVQGYGVATGGTSSSITVSSQTYTLLSFTADGTLTVANAGLFDFLLVAGGGGGGTGWAYGYGGQTFYGDGGGGGGGGVMTLDGVALDAGTYAITIGAGGGSGQTGFATVVGSKLTAVGGGWGGGHSAAEYNHQLRGIGGSGGSAGGNQAFANSEGYVSRAVTNQGNIGAVGA
jgi:hypothetical protein